MNSHSKAIHLNTKPLLNSHIMLSLCLNFYINIITTKANLGRVGYCCAMNFVLKIKCFLLFLHMVQWGLTKLWVQQNWTPSAPIKNQLRLPIAGNERLKLIQGISLFISRIIVN